jgi:hypothetical protein
MMERKHQTFPTKVAVRDDGQLDERAVPEWKALDLAFAKAERVHRKSRETIKIASFEA